MHRNTPKFLDAMINRRNIRIKALQVIYSFNVAGITPNRAEVNKALQTKFLHTSTLLNYLICLTVDVAKYVEIYSNQKASKHLPTAADLVINTKIAGNDIIWQLLENRTFETACKNTNAEAMVEKDLVKQIFTALELTDEYNNYINQSSRTIEEDGGIMKFIFNNLILGDEDVENGINEQFQNYDDDIEMLHLIVNQALEKPKNVQFTKIVTADKETYANELVNTYYSNQNTIMDYAKTKLKNWDPERVAKLDMIIIQLGIGELLYFETIPVKVTINEFIDIAKAYSTPQSGHFVNGILDGVHKDLVRDDKLQKTDFRRF